MWPVVLTVLNYTLALILVPRIITERRESAATLAWVLSILLLPFLGALFYFVFGARRLRRQRLLRRKRSQVLASARAGAGKHHTQKPQTTDEIRMLECVGSTGTFPTTPGNSVEILTDPDKTYERMLGDIAGAKGHVHLQSYIFTADGIGRRFLEALEERARAGVEVRLLVDGVGSFRLKSRDLRPLIAAGGKVGVFAPANPFRRRFSFHLRNHRKILVVDGRVTFTGGLNISDRFRGEDPLGKWRDTHLRIEGPAALDLQELFVEDWHFAVEEKLVSAKYFPDVGPVGESLVQVVGSGPDTGSESIHRAIFASVNVAKERVWLTTPYFIPDRSLLVALEVACLRGIDVRLLVPSKSDNRLVTWAAKSLYPQLIRAGCKVYEYHAGMMHAKILTVDGKWSIVGSANLDRRSFSLNFEASAVLHDAKLTKSLERMFEKDIRQASAVRISDEAKKSFRSRFVEAASLVLAPLL